MTTLEHLRDLLETNQNRFLSGEEIAARLGVSRNAIWKAAQALRAEGYPIEAAPKRGYRLLPQSDVLSKSGVRRFLSGEAAALDLRVLDTVDSTNNALRALAEDGAPEGTVVIALEQTGGRGRRGRGFYSPPGTGVYISVLLRPAISPEQATLITTAAAVAVCRAAERVSAREASIKWVNDVYMGGKKICGILTEAALDLESGRLSYAVLGTGINVLSPAGGFPEEIRDVAGSVLDRPLPDAKNRVAAAYLNELIPLCRALGARQTISEYRRRSFVPGRRITVLRGEQSAPATALEVDDACRLLVEYESGERELLTSGEISIRLDAAAPGASE